MTDWTASGGEPRRRAGRRWRRYILLATLLTGAVLASGFFVFANSIPRVEIKLADSADGIVVLTGGASRIVDAVDLLAAKRGQRLLISGVHRTTTPSALVRLSPDAERLLTCCIDLGHEASNTIGNAIETGRWARERGFRSLIIVTSGWHMPRALVEIRHELPEVRLIPYPVVSDRMRDEPWWSSAQTTRLLLFEYAKYLASHVRVRLDPGPMAAAGRGSHS